jgi:hypothetical protein
MVMRVEYFANGSDECPLILLYGADSGDAITLSEAFNTLTTPGTTRVVVHNLPGFSSVAECRLFASHSEVDRGVTMIQSPNEFECVLSAESWENIVGLLEPFCDSERMPGMSFQYLDESGDTRLLISTERAW